jgi:hypothetical protein
MFMEDPALMRLEREHTQKLLQVQHERQLLEEEVALQKVKAELDAAKVEKDSIGSARGDTVDSWDLMDATPHRWQFKTRLNNLQPRIVSQELSYRRAMFCILIRTALFW